MITAVLIVILSTLLPLKLYSFLRGKQFGGKIRKEHINRYERSKHWDGEKFNNLSETTMNVNASRIPGLLKKQLTGRALRSPAKTIPILPLDNRWTDDGVNLPRFIWYGHSVLLLQLEGLNLLIDPMFGQDASPIAPMSTKRFSDHTLDLIDSLPNIDAVLLTHDHYDHLDYKSITRLRAKAETYLVALGVARHLERWDIPLGQITEFDWWDEKTFNGIRLIFTPSRHFSGRGPVDRSKSLWGGWVFQTKNHRIYWSGDGGYDKHFGEVGRRYGPFDWSFIECGQYTEMWHQIHMMPEESVQAALDAGTRTAIPVHWGGFTLAMHHWTDPVNRFLIEAQKLNQVVCCPHPGQVVTMGDTFSEPWWQEYD
jgi:L-ascorbate metabolism protein UlaG (beta-lactamase superfamily)